MPSHASTRFPPRDWRARGIKTCVQHTAADKSRIAANPRSAANPHVVGKSHIVARRVLLRDASRWQAEHRRLHPASPYAECRAYARVRGVQKRGHGQPPAPPVQNATNSIVLPLRRYKWQE